MLTILPALMQFWATWKARLMLGGVIALGVMLAAFRLISIGKQQQMAEDARRRLEAVKQRRQVDDEVGQLGNADLDRRHSRWLRDDE